MSIKAQSPKGCSLGKGTMPWLLSGLAFMVDLVEVDRSLFASDFQRQTVTLHREPRKGTK